MNEAFSLLQNDKKRSNECRRYGENSRLYSTNTKLCLCQSDADVVVEACWKSKVKATVAEALLADNAILFQYFNYSYFITRKILKRPENFCGILRPSSSNAAGRILKAKNQWRNH